MLFNGEIIIIQNNPKIPLFVIDNRPIRVFPLFYCITCILIAIELAGKLYSCVSLKGSPEPKRGQLELSEDLNIAPQ